MPYPPVDTALTILKLLPLLLLFPSPTTADCLTQFLALQQSNTSIEGGTDNHGRPTNIQNATAMTYALCKQICGSSSHIGSWGIFSQRFSTWLLPFLALVSQLPFGANNKIDNLTSILLNVGSPTLATYSLLLTLLNARWVSLRFSKICYPNAQIAARILSTLQQIPLKISSSSSSSDKDDSDGDVLLASLIVLPENDAWWSDLLVWLDINYTYTWSFANVASIGWVVIAFLLTVIDTFTTSSSNLSPPLNFNGLAVAFTWLWLLPLVISWLQFAPRCDRVSLHRAVRHANRLAYVAAPSPSSSSPPSTNSPQPIPANTKSSRRAISIAIHNGALTADEHRTPPIYNYARIFRWCAAVETVYAGFKEAGRRAGMHLPVKSEVAWVDSEKEGEVRPENRRGGEESVAEYIRAPDHLLKLKRKSSKISSGLIYRMLIASICALVLTWGTVAGAVIVEWFTPTIGLSCKSGSFLLYAVISTISWVALVLSSIVSAQTHPVFSIHNNLQCSTPPTPVRLSASIALRRLGKLLAALNALWLVLICLFQFIGVYDTCFCNGSVLYLGRARSYAVWILTSEDIAAFWYPGVGGTVLACGAVIVFLIFTNLLLDPLASVS